jgi:hypothetical protein
VEIKNKLVLKNLRFVTKDCTGAAVPAHAQVLSTTNSVDNSNGESSVNLLLNGSDFTIFQQKGENFQFC